MGGTDGKGALGRGGIVRKNSLTLRVKIYILVIGSHLKYI